MSGVAACGGAGRGYDHYTDILRSVPSDHSLTIEFSVSARHISEGAARCPFWPPEQFFFFYHLQNVIAVVFSDIRCKNACACRFVPMFSSIAHKKTFTKCNCPHNCAQTSFRLCAGL